MNKIVVVDDHPVVLAALTTVFSQSCEHFTVDCVASAKELEKLLDGLECPSVVKAVFLDLSLPDRKGIELLGELSSRYGFPVIAMSGYASAQDIRACAQCGAKGYIEKTSNLGLYPAVLNVVLSGGKYFPYDLIHESSVNRKNDNMAIPLTERQREVLDLLVEGKPTKIIAAALGISEGTVKNHIGTLLERFQVNSRSQLISTVMKSGGAFAANA